MLVVGNDEEAVEADLASGRLCCPGCGGPLGRYGWARRRLLRTLGEDRELRPRRGWCTACEAAHVLLPAWSVPRRRDAAEVIMAALLAKAAGAGHRAIAVALDRPTGTVRGWLRRATARAEITRSVATRWVHALDPSAGPIEPAGSLLGDAIEALGVALGAAVRRFGPHHSCSVIAATAGLLSPDG
ncbi:MAG: DUF6431 domain-containing protein [Actinomycetota bacterium]|nr:DUF6431 domain-containing protein [Actinomycetota bacterium]